MRKTEKIAVFSALTVLIVLMSHPLDAGEAMHFLKVRPSARANAIGEGIVAIPDEIGSISANPAGLGLLKSAEISFTHLAYIADTTFENIALGGPVNDRFSVGASFTILNYGRIARTLEDSFGVYAGTNGEFAPSNLAVSAAAAYRLAGGLLAGVSLKYASDDIDGDRTSALLLDTGFHFSSDDLSAGIGVYNLGTTAGGDLVPTTIFAGAAVSAEVSPEGALRVAAGANYTLSGNTAASAGFEYVHDGMFFARGSFGLGRADPVGLGAGIKHEIEGFTCQADYNVSFAGELGTLHRLTFVVKLQEEKKRRPAVSGRNILKSYFRKK